MPVANSINCCKKSRAERIYRTAMEHLAGRHQSNRRVIAIVDEIIRLKPDFVTFSEVRNYNNTRFCDRIVQSLKAKGETYYSFYSYDSGLLSRHPITDSLTIFPEKDDHGSIYKMTSKIKGHKIAVYTAHLDYLNDAYYNVRGYDGSTWKKFPFLRQCWKY